MIRAGTTQAVFNVTIVDNNLLDGTQPVTISARAPGFFERSSILMVNDNDSATLRIKLPHPRGREGDPPFNATLRSGSKPAKDILVRLTSSNTNEARVLSTVVLPAGKNSVDFPIFIVDDRRIDGTQTATITAHVENWIDDSITVEVQDNDQRVMGVRLPHAPAKVTAP